MAVVLVDSPLRVSPHVLIAAPRLVRAILRDLVGSAHTHHTHDQDRTKEGRRDHTPRIL